MVSVQIYGTGQYLEVLDSNITYIKTAGDLGELTKVNSSYSWTMKFPKTPNNTQTLEGLGLVGSGSRTPYEKIYVNLLENGFPIVVKGLLNIQQTSDDYKIYIQEGFIEFINDVNNETVGDALDLSALDHTRNYPTILESLDLTLPYAYLIADVNGKYFPNESNTTNLDSAFMSPYANIKYIFDKIFEEYLWTYELNESVEESLATSWMSYPSEIVLDSSSKTDLGEVSDLNVLGVFYKTQGRGERVYKIPERVSNFDPVFFERLNDTDFKVLQTGNYEVVYFSQGYTTLTDPFGGTTLTSYDTGVMVNDNVYRLGRRGGEVTVGVELTHQMQLNVGEIVSLVAVTGSYTDRTISVNITEAYMNFGYISDGAEISFTQALIKLKISDFVKEIMTRESLTAFVDAENKHIKFLTLQQRVSADVVDWSSKYIERKKESYLYQDYAQSNLMKHKYDDDVSDYSDGNLEIDNANLPIEKTIYQSFTHSPIDEFSIFLDNGTDYAVPRLNMFEVEVREDEATGDLIGKYKFLKDRFFYVRAVHVERDIYIDGNLVDGFPMVSLNNVLFKDIVNSRYDTFMNIANDAKVHDIDLALSLSDIHALDLSKVYYFEKQAAYYILNRLQYKTGKECTGNFLKVLPFGFEIEQNAFSDGFSNGFNI